MSKPEPQRLAERAAPPNPDLLKPILGIGAGVRLGGVGSTSTGEPTSGLVTARLGHELSPSLALSLRPSLIFGNRDLNGRDNNQTEFQLPITVDFLPRGAISPYIGGGIVNNADSAGQTDGMMVGGIDVNISRHLTFGVTISRIFQNRIQDNDWEAMTVLYLRY